MITSKILPRLTFTVIICVLAYFNFCRISGMSNSTNSYLLSTATKNHFITPCQFKVNIQFIVLSMFSHFCCFHILVHL